MGEIVGKPFEEDSPTKRWIDCDVEYEYFGEERKVRKAATKQLSEKDRSKYKKTDQRKKSNQPREFTGDREKYLKGMIIAIASQGIIVDVEGKTLTCTLRGLLKKVKTQLKNLVTVGDFVLIELISDSEGTVVHVEPRRSVLSRADNLSRRKEQLIAANVDQVMVTVSVISPALKTSLIDRYIIAAQKGNMQPVIVINKIDLLDEEHLENEDFEKEKELFQDILLIYTNLGIPVIPLSVVTRKGLDQLKEIMHHKISVFSGQSGVGKSSLINAMTGQSLPIGDVVERTNKGSHTTSTAQLLKLECGGWCIDTPGIKSFGIWNLNKKEIEEYFTEIASFGCACHYPNCSHFQEETCAVMQAVENGNISPLRYESYLMLMHNTDEKHVRR